MHLTLCDVCDRLFFIFWSSFWSTVVVCSIFDSLTEKGTFIDCDLWTQRNGSAGRTDVSAVRRAIQATDQKIVVTFEVLLEPLFAQRKQKINHSTGKRRTWMTNKKESHCCSFPPPSLPPSCLWKSTDALFICTSSLQNTHRQTESLE